MKEQIFLELSFPKYTKQLRNSRFLNYFNILQKLEEEKTSQVPFQSNQYEINLEKIKRGEDKRASLLIKNLPLFMNKKKLTHLLADVGNINFLFIPYDMELKQSFGYAYINMINYKNVIKVYQKLNGMVFSNSSYDSPIMVNYSDIQGKVQLNKYLEEEKLKRKM